MRILIIERNLLWSARLANAARGLGHEAVVVDTLPATIEADVAIINLAEPDPRVVQPLKAAGAKVLAHAGHKEQDRLELGRQAGCDLVVTNGELTHKLPEILAKLLAG